MSEFESGIADRMKAVMQEFHLSGYRSLGERCGATNSAVSNWLNGYNRPPVAKMIQLCDRTGVTLDWLYRGHAGLMDPALADRLHRRMLPRTNR